MRLLDKKEIATKHAAQKKIEIEEGIKIARKVDALRETASKEEARLSKFRTETTKQVQSEIDALIIDRALLKDEVETLCSEKKNLSIPLDAQWEKVKDREALLIRAKDELTALFADVAVSVAQIKKAEKLLRIEESRIAYEREAVLKNFEESQDALAKARETLREAGVMKTSIQDFSRNKEQELASREAGVAALERNAQMRMRAQDARELELNARETLIADRYQTLLRDEKRHVITNT